MIREEGGRVTAAGAHTITLRRPEGERRIERSRIVRAYRVRPGGEPVAVRAEEILVGHDVVLEVEAR